MSTLDLHYASPGPVAERFLFDDSFVSGIMGPIGSGKTTACIVKALMCSSKQPKDARGRRRSRGAVIRNTYPELNTTTIKSWHEWVPKDCGRWQAEGPPTHFVQGTDGLDAEVMFLALDRPEDVRKLLSLELTWAYINEAKEVPKAILDGLTGRVGRFPPVKDGGCVDPIVVMDTNPPDSDHWWYTLSENDTSTESGVELIASMRDAERELREHGMLRDGQSLFRFYRQPGGRTAEAENLANLRPAYYTIAAAGKSSDWIKVYIEGEYGFVRTGKPCYPEYSDSMHCREFELIPGLPILIGVDFGLTPAAVFLQRKATGAWRAFDEIVSERMGATALADAIKQRLHERYPEYEVADITGDPAGAQGGNDDRSAFQIMAANGVAATPAETNDFTTRREAVAHALTRIVDGEPGLMIHPRCAVLRKACAGGYQFKRVAVVGQERFQDKPDKNRFSHVAEGLQYGLLGGGEGRLLKRAPSVRAKPKTEPRARSLRAQGSGSWMG
jgi:hypothetical protein